MYHKIEITIIVSYLATDMITPTATRKHPSSWFILYLLPRKIMERRICHTRNVCRSHSLYIKMVGVTSSTELYKNH